MRSQLVSIDHFDYSICMPLLYTGAMLYACSELDLMDSDLTLSAALLLGTIVSAVDPVAVSCRNDVACGSLGPGQLKWTQRVLVSVTKMCQVKKCYSCSCIL